MQTIEFEATAYQHTIRIPDNIPDGMTLKVLLWVDESVSANKNTEQSWKDLLASMPNVGSDEDFSRPLEYAREQTWDF